MSSICYVRIDFTDANNFRRIPSPDPVVLHKQGSYYQHYFFTWFGASSPLRGYVCGIDYSPPSYKIDKRVVDENFIIFILEGKGTINGNQFSAGQFFVLPPNYSTTMISDKDTPWKLCWISWRGSMSDYFQKIFESFEPEKIYVSPNAYCIQRIFSALIYADHSHADIPEMVRGFTDFVASLLARDITPKDMLASPGSINQRSVKYVEQAKRIFAEQYATINISKLSNMLYLNRKYFCQIFHSVVGITPQQYLINLRLQNSIFYLENSNMTLKNVAETCGYSSYTGYVDAFKGKYGVTPKEYRKRFNK